MRSMSFTWHLIREHLLRTSRTLGFQRDFDTIRHRHKHIFGYGNPDALLDALHGGAGAPAQKNLVLTTLIEAAQSDRPEADCALTLMLLALWPGLDAVLSRTRRRRIGTVDELTSEILMRAIEAIRCLDLGRVGRMAATVLRNIERDIVRAYQREANHLNLRTAINPGDLAIEYQAFSSNWLHRELGRLIGPDAILVARVAVKGFSQSEVAVQLGLSEAATRKRYQRATRRLRNALQEFT